MFVGGGPFGTGPGTKSGGTGHHARLRHAPMIALSFKMKKNTDSLSISKLHALCTVCSVVLDLGFLSSLSLRLLSMWCAIHMYFHVCVPGPVAKSYIAFTTRALLYVHIRKSTV